MASVQLPVAVGRLMRMVDESTAHDQTVTRPCRPGQSPVSFSSVSLLAGDFGRQHGKGNQFACTEDKVRFQDGIGQVERNDQYLQSIRRHGRHPLLTLFLHGQMQSEID